MLLLEREEIIIFTSLTRTVCLMFTVQCLWGTELEDFIYLFILISFIFLFLLNVMLCSALLCAPMVGGS
ncbi:hypothetical protein Fmac_013081 [Flemingia macrophylla]|uniref:NADH dehydrogenase subunit 1 n=1 Tax=Flemingia macrophylla TaxID=520843 RepID=A0ABD1MS61_9FABA